MSNIKYQEMSNTEIKLCIKTLENLFESKKRELIKTSEELNKIEKDYLSAKHELEIRKNIFN
jgi:hypothetical protein